MFYFLIRELWKNLRMIVIWIQIDLRACQTLEIRCQFFFSNRKKNGLELIFSKITKEWILNFQTLNFSICFRFHHEGYISILIKFIKFFSPKNNIYFQFSLHHSCELRIIWFFRSNFHSVSSRTFFKRAPCKYFWMLISLRF